MDLGRVGSWRVGMVLLLRIADLPGNGQPDTLAFVLPNDVRALVQVLLPVFQLGDLGAELCVLVPAGGLGRGHQLVVAVLL